MRTATVREFRDQATTLLKATEPILVTRRGKIVGVFLPSSGSAVPLEIKRDLFYALTDGIGRRDPDDIDVLALALRLQAPLWSNDRDFERTGVEQMTTPDLLKLFFGPSPRPR